MADEGEYSDDAYMRAKRTSKKGKIIAMAATFGTRASRNWALSSRTRSRRNRRKPASTIAFRMGKGGNHHGCHSRERRGVPSLQVGSSANTRGKCMIKRFSDITEDMKDAVEQE